MSSACDSCPSKEGCTSQATCPSAIGKDPLANGSSIKTVIGVASGKGGATLFRFCTWHQRAYSGL